MMRPGDRPASTEFSPRTNLQTAERLLRREGGRPAGQLWRRAKFYPYGKRNISRRISERRPLWSDGGSYCAGCRKFTFPNEEIAQERLEDLIAAPKVRKQKHSHLLHVYQCPRGRGWHIGHDYKTAGAG